MSEEKEKVFTDIMLDLETMSTQNDAAIMSIGAYIFDPNTGECGGTFHSKINLQSCMDLGLSVDASTIEWWLGQEKEAQEALLAGMPVPADTVVNEGAVTGADEFQDALDTGELKYEKENIKEALIGLGAWLGALQEDGILDIQRVWGNGIAADIVWIESAMDKFKAFYSHILPPWEFWTHRDVRTIRDIAVAAGCEDFKNTMEFEGVPHDALADAQFQAQYVAAYWQFLTQGVCDER